jgi:cysteinyl-tRNA synthetase
MIEQTLGLPIDIHGGGNDLIFPHHENEMAQGMCADHAEGYANYWLHNGFLNFGSEKMSKSLGNVQLAHDLVTRWPPEALRWALLASHYRQPLAWTDEVVDQAKSALNYLYGVLRRARDVAAPAAEPSETFLDALHDDLNTPRAFAELHALGQQLETASGAARAEAKSALLASANLIGFLLADPEAWFQGDMDVAQKARVEALIAERDQARREKDWATADRIRGVLDDLNIEVMDGPAGATWKVKERA